MLFRAVLSTNLYSFPFPKKKKTYIHFFKFKNLHLFLLKYLLLKFAVPFLYKPTVTSQLFHTPTLSSQTHFSEK